MNDKRQKLEARRDKLRHKIRKHRRELGLIELQLSKLRYIEYVANRNEWNNGQVEVVTHE
jgi:hypothetical protein